MAYPPAYSRDFSFTDFETNNPGVPKPGPWLDTEFDDVSVALTATQAALALIQRADGALANGSVGEDQLQPGLFDAIGDAAVADAEAAAAAAAASASAASGSASSAASSAGAASGSAATASGAAAQAGVSQGIAQSAANDAAGHEADAEAAADVAAQAANDTAGSVAAAQLHEEAAFEWAEKLEGPVEPAPPGWPEAVDDGMFSSKWWAIRARDYMTVTHLDLGSGQTDIGAAMADWLAVPGNEMPLGLVYATWGAPPLEYALTDPSDPTNPDSWTLISGGPGPAGPPNTLTIGTVTNGIPTSATITGVAPNQVLNLVIEPGPTGATGAAGATGAVGADGPPNTLTIGTVVTGAAGATITGASPNQTLNLSIPQGIQGIQGTQGIQGIQGIQGPPGPTNFANPSALVGLAIVNGASANAMRADAAPALSQAIAPTWTGQHAWALQLRGPAGSAAAPTYSTSGDPDTGVYSSGADHLGLAAGGSLRVNINTTTVGIAGDVKITAADQCLGLISSASNNACYTGYYGAGAAGSRTGYAGFAGDTVFRIVNEVGALVHTPNVMQADGGFVSASSRAIKRETGAPSLATNILARLRPILYRLLDGDDSEQLGLIAEEVHEVCPQLSDGKTVAYDRLAILLLAAWQEEKMVA